MEEKQASSRSLLSKRVHGGAKGKIGSSDSGLALSSLDTQPLHQL